MVSIPAAEQITKAPLTADQARRFLKDHEVQATGSDYHGAWQSEDKIFQDVSHKHETLDAARKAGIRDKQIAGYDVGGSDINTQK
jgi:L-ribulose-5-phosphate 3-epimerase UlaE